MSGVSTSRVASRNASYSTYASASRRLNCAIDAKSLSSPPPSVSARPFSSGSSGSDGVYDDGERVR